MGEYEQKEPVILHGIGVSPGVVIGPVYLMVSENVTVAERTIGADQVEHEVCRLEDALIETRRQLRKIQRDLEARAARSDASVFDAHLMVLDDRAFIEEVLKSVRTKRVNVEAAVRNVSEAYVNVLASLEDDYLRERVADVRDVARRILRNLAGDSEDSSLSSLRKRHIVVAADLAPSDTATLRRDIVSAFATDLGSPTSHTAVMARALEIPAVVGLHNITLQVSTGDEVLIDGNKGVFILHPTAEQLEEYGRLEETRRTIESGLTSSLHDLPAETTDGHRIVLSANSEGVEEMDAVLRYGAEGVGLFRSEYLYLTEDRLVTEDEQFDVYNNVASRLAPAPVILRTLDLGGDKFFRENRPVEPNPFLGCRSIRLSLLHPDVFKAQLRAMLRASVHGNVKIMYPLISRVSEVIRANEILEECKQELDQAGIPYDKDIDVGIMIEVPSAALMADVLAKHVKFFSIGTNDLVQYTMAVDRVNERVAYLYEPTDPSVLRLIKSTIDAGHRHGVWVGLCGELAADPLATPLLIGLGLDELSMAPSAVPWVKDAIRSVSYECAVELANTALGAETATEVLGLCRQLTREVAPELMELI